MATVTERARDAHPGLAPARARRRPWLIAMGALLVSVGALAVVWLVGAAGQRQEVLVVRQPVEYGQAVADADLGIARLSVDPGVAVVAGTDRAAVVGQVATTRLVPGMVLAPGLVEAAAEPGTGRVLVPVALPAERMPAGGLRAGDRVLAVDTEPAVPTVPTAPTGAPSAGVSAVVVRVGPMDVNGVTVVDVTVQQADGPALAVAAANGRVAVVVQPAGQ